MRGLILVLGLTLLASCGRKHTQHVIEKEVEKEVEVEKKVEVEKLLKQKFEGFWYLNHGGSIELIVGSDGR